MEPKRVVERGTIWGILLIVVGGILLLNTLDIFRFAWELAVAAAFMAGAVAFGTLFATDRRQWWALFPAFGLGFVGLMIALGRALPHLDIGGTLFLGGLGLVFAAVYHQNRQQFWPIIPAGALLTLALITAIDNTMPRFDTGWIFFGGLAATFGFIYHEFRQQAQWALVVALVLGGFATLLLVGSMMRILFPLALVALGVYLLTQHQRRSGGPQ